MPKLLLDLVEGGTLFLERQGEFLAVGHIDRQNKETVLGLLRRADFGHLHGFIQNEILTVTMQAAQAVPPPDSLSDTVRAIIKEFRKQVDEDEEI